MPSRAHSNSESDFPCFFISVSEVVLGTCPACAGRHRPHTYSEGCNKATTSVTAEIGAPKDLARVEGISLDRVLPDSHHEVGENHPTASSSTDPRPPGLEPQLGSGPDTMPRERPALETQPMEVSVPQKDTSAAMKRLVNRFEELF